MSDENEKKTRPYRCEVFGVTFMVEGTNKGNVTAHIVRRVREEIKIRTADFDDGMAAERMGIPLEFAGTDANADLFGAQEGATALAEG